MDEARLADLARRHGIEVLVQFGSTVSGKTHPRSDVDLGVLVERVPQSLEDYGALIGDLQALFPDREVDVAFINRADPLFLKKILDECRLLYGATRRFHELRMYAFRRYQDHRRYLTLEREYIARKLDAIGRR